MTLFEIEQQVRKCTKCSLCKTRKNIVFSKGDPKSKIMMIAEAPGKDEDEQGIPFVGRAGKLLDNMLKSIEKTSDDVYICNILKCRPPNNRKPTKQEMDLCLPYLYSQIEIIEPKAIIALGNTALEGLTGYGSIMRRCGSWENLDINGMNIMLMPCYHPSALLRNPNWKKPAWYAMQKVKEVF